MHHFMQMNSPVAFTLLHIPECLQDQGHCYIHIKIAPPNTSRVCLKYCWLILSASNILIQHIQVPSKVSSVYKDIQKLKNRVPNILYTAWK